LSLLPINSTRLERILAAACDFGIDPDVIRGIADSTRCPPDFLPWLAWAMKIEGWEAAETDEQQRALIREAIPVHKTKGTVGAIRRVLAAVNVNAEYKDWIQTGGAPFTFELTAWANNNRGGEGSILSDELYQRLKALIDAVKNERSHYEIKLGARFDGGLRAANAATVRAVDRRTMAPDPLQPDGFAQTLQAANAQDSRSVLRVFADVKGLDAEAAATLLAGNAMTTRTVVRVTMEVINL